MEENAFRGRTGLAGPWGLVSPKLSGFSLLAGPHWKFSCLLGVERWLCGGPRPF
jgi:hypothetical protein